jgi:hypothetical protein
MAKSEVDALRVRARTADTEGRPGDAATDWLAAGDRLAVRHKDAAVEAFRHATRAFLRARAPAAARDAADRGVAAASGARWTHTLVDALRSRAEVWEHLGRRGDAVTDLRAAVTATAGRSSSPERCVARAELGMALFRVGLGDEGRAELEAALKSGARKKWMEPQVTGWSDARDALQRAWSWAAAGGRPVGVHPSGAVYVGGEPLQVRDPLPAGPGAHRIALRERSGPFVLTVPVESNGVARLTPDPTEEPATDPTTEATETGRPGPDSAPTEV